MTFDEQILLRDRQDLKLLLSRKEGLRFMWRLLSAAGVFRSSFSPDAAVMSYNEGKRAHGLQLLAEIMEISPEAYIKMTKLAKEDEDERRRYEEMEAASD